MKIHSFFITSSPILEKPKSYNDYSSEEIGLMCEDSLIEYNNGKSIDSEEFESRFRNKIKNV